MTEPPTVAIIGCGPGGMFFCHALEMRRRKLEEAGDEAALEALPVVTCFERASVPGGVWRAKRSFGAADNGDDSSEEEGPVRETRPVRTEKMAKEKPADTAGITNMYEALWTNGPQQCIELFDYTFDEHFGGPLPVYMPRKELLEYMLARVTKNCPNFFEKYAKFNTTVLSVKYDESKQKFQVTTLDYVTGREVVGEYDKCIWAAGENGRPVMPAPLLRTFRDGGFKGRIIHSSDTSNFESDVKGKRILLVGGSYSAEDLALTAAKVGAEKIYISARDQESPITWTRSWPQKKVTVLLGMTPVNVTEGGNCIEFAEVQWEHPWNYTRTSKSIARKVRDIDTIILCTGYTPNHDMLDEELRSPFKNPYDAKVNVPSNWKMEPNCLSEVMGDVEPKDVVWYNSEVYFPELYNGILISNPSMLFLDPGMHENPIFALDVSAWLLLGYITGTTEIPSREEMSRRNLEEVLRQMQNISIRYFCDRAYSEAWARKEETGELDEEDQVICDAWEKAADDKTRIQLGNLARMMQEANYPVSYGSYDHLNEKAEKVIDYCMLAYFHRYNIDPEDEEESSWRTFRDYTDGDKFKSLFTGAASVPLTDRWMDLDANSNGIIGVTHAQSMKVDDKTLPIPLSRTESDESRQPKDDMSFKSTPLDGDRVVSVQ